MHRERIEYVCTWSSDECRIATVVFVVVIVVKEASKQWIISTRLGIVFFFVRVAFRIPKLNSWFMKRLINSAEDIEYVRKCQSSYFSVKNNNATESVARLNPIDIALCFSAFNPISLKGIWCFIILFIKCHYFGCCDTHIRFITWSKAHQTSAPTKKKLYVFRFHNK